MDNTTAAKRPMVSQATKTRRLAQIGMLSAIATVLMLFEVPLPFLAPSFYEMDLSELPVLIGTFAMGPVAGIVIEFIKILLNLVINGTDTAFVGELANFIMGCAFIVPAGLFYKWKKTKKNAVIGMACGTVLMAVVGCFVNAFVLLPAYATAFGMPVSAFVEMGAAINPAIDGLFGFVVLAVAPFNLIKGIVVSLLALLLYKHISGLLKGQSW